MNSKTQYAGYECVSPEEAARVVKSGNRVGISMIRQPKRVCIALSQRKDELQGVRLICNHLGGKHHPWLQAGWASSFRVLAPFISTPQARVAVNDGRADSMPQLIGLDNGTRQADRRRLGCYACTDVYMLSVTPPNKHGFCSYGHATWYSPTAVKTAGIVIAEIDPTLPWTYGEYVHTSDIDLLVAPLENSDGYSQAKPTPAPPPNQPQLEAEKVAVIGSYISDLVKDGDTLQIGDGVPSRAVTEFLRTKNDLGLDTEAIFPETFELIREGVFTGANKNGFRGKIVLTGVPFVEVDKEGPGAIEFMDNNPAFEFRDWSWLLNVPRIAANNNMVAINSALAVDLLGQIVIDHIGSAPYSGIGGQVEYAVGAHYSNGGRYITAIISTAKGGAVSRIIPRIDAGGVVSVPACYADYLVTEHGVVNLEGKGRRERADAVISVADPKFQPELREAANKLFNA